MNAPSEPTATPQFDDLIHAPMRLRICASLAPLQWAEFAQLREALSVTDSVLSKHLKQLTTVKYVQIERFTHSGRSRVRVSLTVEGRTAYVGHVAALRAMTQGTFSPSE